MSRNFKDSNVHAALRVEMLEVQNDTSLGNVSCIDHICRIGNFTIPVNVSSEGRWSLELLMELSKDLEISANSL